MIGPDNAIGALGVTWREALALARDLGVPVAHVGARQLISARALLDALERRAAPSPPTEQSAEAVVLSRLGRRTA